MATVLWGTALALLVLLAVVVARRYRMAAHFRAAEASRLKKEERVREACREAMTVVDLTAMDGGASDPLPTPALTSIGQRLHSLDQELTQLVRRSEDVRLAEALSEMRHVAVSLEVALEAERSLRLHSGQVSVTQQSRSKARIAKRSAELDLAARGVTWVVTDYE